MPALRWIARYAYVPTMLLGLNGLALALVSRGVTYLVVAPILLAAIAFSLGMEHVLPYEAAWNEGHDDTPKDILHAIVYEVQNTNCTLFLPIIAWLVPWQGIWPREWPLLAQLGIAILAIDAAGSLVHYASHKVEWLWRLHAVHHGVYRLYSFNGLVRHPAHQLIDIIVGSLPLALIGMPVPVAVLLGLAVAIQLLVQHSNVDYRLGPFEGWLSVGHLHRLHHVNWREDGDVNFGLFFTFWDRILGTLRMPDERRPGVGEIGIQEREHYPQAYARQLIEPFRRNRPAPEAVGEPSRPASSIGLRR